MKRITRYCRDCRYWGDHPYLAGRGICTKEGWRHGLVLSPWRHACEAAKRRWKEFAKEVQTA